MTSSHSYGAIFLLALFLAVLSACTPANGVASSAPPPRGGATMGDTGPVVLGGMDSAFIAAFGQPVDMFGGPEDTSAQSAVLAFDHYAHTFVDAVMTKRGDSSSETLAHRIVFVLLSAPPDGTWTESTAHTACTSFMPSDAHRVSETPVTDAKGVRGIDTLYTSAWLAQTLPASMFVDQSSATIVPGTFNIQYLYSGADESHQFDSCELELGTQQGNAL